MSSNQEGGSSDSMSIEETNKLRAKLGLKPLDADNASGDSSKTERKDVHAPAPNLLDERQSVKVKEKVERVRKMRKMHQKLSNVKTLAATADGEDDNVLSWVSKSRSKEGEKRKAEQKQRELDAMDEDFGVSALMEDELKPRNGRGSDYTSADLRGLKVQHDQEAFMDGSTTILTLKDHGILDDEEEGDVLVNPNLLDMEREQTNRENKKMKPDYRPWEEEELDENGMPKEKVLLGKYDEEISGTQKKSFVIDKGGTADLSERKALNMIKKDMQARAQTLDYSRGELAREYYTNQEMTAFNKPKKTRKVKKRMLKADELLKTDPYADEEDQKPSDHDRTSSSSKRHESAPPVQVKQERRQDTETRLSEDEEDDSELRIALARTRRLRQRERQVPSPVQQEVQMKMEVESDEEEDEENRGVAFGGAVSMSTTSEFCRTVGTETSPTHRNPSLPVDSDGDDDDGDDSDEMDIDDEDAPAAAGWNQVDLRQKKKEKEKIDVKVEPEDSVILEAEPIVSSSLAACLELADQKGFLEQQRSKDELRQKGVSLQLVGSAAELDAKTRDKQGEIRERERRERDRERDRDRGHDRGDRDRDRYDRERNPLDKAGYKPKVKLEYVDDTGRLLDQKGAFRQLSWRFHGKTSGKAKTEKRKKKLEEQTKLLKMSSTDTPLATRALLEEKLKETKSPFLILSGSAQRSLTANTITKN